MRALSNNHYQKSLPFAGIHIHSTELSKDDTDYDSLPKQSRMTSTTGISNNQVDYIMNLVKNTSSSTDISITYDTSNVLTVAQRVAQFSKQPQSTTTPSRKLNRTRVQPIPDSTSDSADSFPHAVFVPSYRQQIPQAPTISSIDIPPLSGSLEYIHDDRFDSTTTVDHVKNDVIAIELMEQQHPSQVLPDDKQQFSWTERLGESIRLLPANVIAITFIGLISGLIVSAIVVIIIA